jgi:hypothetical protein
MYLTAVVFVCLLQAINGSDRLDLDLLPNSKWIQCIEDGRQDIRWNLHGSGKLHSGLQLPAFAKVRAVAADACKALHPCSYPAVSVLRLLAVACHTRRHASQASPLPVNGWCPVMHPRTAASISLESYQVTTHSLCLCSTKSKACWLRPAHLCWRARLACAAGVCSDHRIR